MNDELRRTLFRCVIIVAGFGVYCVPFFVQVAWIVYYGPRAHARLAMTYRYVCKLSVADRDDPSFSELPTHDVWGQPFQFSKTDEDLTRVMSSGPNGVSPESGFDADDIYSDMPASPMDPIEARLRRQMIVATGIAFSAWLLLIRAYRRSRRASS